MSSRSLEVYIDGLFLWQSGVLILLGYEEGEGGSEGPLAVVDLVLERHVVLLAVDNVATGLDHLVLQPKETKLFFTSGSTN